MGWVPWIERYLKETLSSYCERKPKIEALPVWGFPSSPRVMNVGKDMVAYFWKDISAKSQNNKRKNLWYNQKKISLGCGNFDGCHLLPLLPVIRLNIYKTLITALK